MKRKIVFIFLIIAIFCSSGIYILTNPILEITENNEPAIPVIKERLFADVEMLTSISPPRNFENISSLNKAAGYIENELKNTGGEIEIQNFSIGNDVYKNIICSFGIENPERIVIGAHYDVCGDQPGADDNASGVAGLLEIGRLIKQLQPLLNYRIDLVAYSTEEPPFFRTAAMGSAIHAKSLAKEGVKVKAMISLEMIGFYSDKPNSQHFPIFFLKWFYPTTANFITVVGKLFQRKTVKHMKEYMSNGSNIDVQSINAPKILPGIDFSDHLNYWKHGYQAVMITNTSFYRNPNYHMATDKIETLDFDKMAEVVKGVYWAIINF